MTFRAHTSDTFCFSCLTSGLLAFLLLSFAPISRSQSAQSSTPSSQASPPAPSAQPGPSDSKPPAASKPPKHVITNEDLEAKSTPSKESKLSTTDNSPVLDCEAACEQQARQELGYGPDQEAEWRLQIVQARRDLIADKDWRNLLSKALQQLDTYCLFLMQANQQVSPSGNDYYSRVQRAKADQYFENMDRTLRGRLDSTFRRLQESIQEAGVLSPVRAALMYAQANRIGNHTCELPPRR